MDNTYEITKADLQGAEPTATGYKAIKWDSGTQAGYHYYTFPFYQ